MASVTALGVLVCLYVAYSLPLERLNLGFVLLSLATILIGSRIVVQIPRIKGQISVSDTFIFLCLLLFGREAAVLLAAADAYCTSRRISKKRQTMLFNTAAVAISTFLCATTVRFFFGPAVQLVQGDQSPEIIMAICLTAFVQYLANSGLVATAVALKADKPVFEMWRTNFLWTSITYFGGAAAAVLIAKFIGAFGLYAFLATVPIIGIIYFTYSTYLKNVEAASAQAELAERYVEELSQHIAEQERISRALKESEEHFRNAFDHAAGMALVTPDGHWLQVNESLCQMLGYSEEELLSGSFRNITHSDDLGEALVRLHQLLEGEVATFQMEKRYLHKNGQPVWVLLSASLIRDEADHPRHLIFQIQNVSDRKQAEDQIRHAAFHDGLTGLPNRTLLADRLSLAIERAKRAPDYKYSVLFIDLDRFKIVNDSLGHDMGDKLLVDLSQRLVVCLRQVDTVARLGGDEFAVLLDGVTSPADATEVAARIQDSLMQPFDLDGQPFVTTASIGIAHSSGLYERPEDILRDADTAMYRAKANGKARSEVFDLAMHIRAVESLRLENELRQAIERGEIVPHFQPLVSLADGRIIGFEALARWEHPERGFMSPVDFIPLAEETGLISQLDMCILRQACRQVSKWQKAFPQEEPLTLSVNLSGRQFRKINLIEEVQEIISKTGIAPDTLRLEITESVLMDNAAQTAEMLRQLKSTGVKLSIDDFGTGYSSLSYLHRFPFDILKIDRSFVGRMSTDRESRGIVKTITTLAFELNKQVIAEGVESNEHRLTLTELGCGYGQGYYFAKPLAADQAEQLLQTDLPLPQGKAAPTSPLPALSETGLVETVRQSYAM
jgi:diguanylate cyclase (GGDEF)-like protein/PAS domain S-box-containing protein